MSSVRREIAAEAAAWVADLHGPDCGPETQQAFSEWLRISPVHVDEYLNAVVLWECLSSPGLDAALQNDIASTQDVLRSNANNVAVLRPNPDPRTINAANDGGTSAEKDSSGSSRGQRYGWLAIAASVIFAIITTIWMLRSDSVLRTTRGETRVATLKDGSVVQLNANTELVVHFGTKERHLELKSGEAFFDVAKDPSHPFVVQSGTVSARALGTKFNVARTGNTTAITVAEGRVRVMHDSAVVTATQASTENPVELSAGQRALADSGSISTHTADLEAVLAWREGRLFLDGQSLAEVIAVFNGQNVLQIRLADPVLGQRRITGVFSLHDPESLLAFLEGGGDIVVHRESREKAIVQLR